MRHHVAGLLTSTALTVAIVCPASSGPNSNAKIVVHLSDYHGPKVQKPMDPTITTCSNVHSEVPCSGVITAGSLYPPRLYPYAYLLVMDGDAAEGIAGLSVSLDYDPAQTSGVDVFSWFLCGSQEFPTTGVHGPWPAPLSTNRIAWDPGTGCQRLEPGGPGTGAIAVAGALYLASYHPAVLSLISSPADGLAEVMSCAGVVDTVEGGGVPRTSSHLGTVRFSAGGNEAGYNPCGLATPVETATWSGIKSQLHRGP